jgi:pimeloyl-ACP methyl ester carboxylesterase
VIEISSLQSPNLIGLVSSISITVILKFKLKMSDNKTTLQNVFAHTTSTHRFEVRWTQVGDASKPPVIFIHGTPWSSFEWRNVASVLKEHYCIYLYDHPGFESSPQPTRHDGKEPDLDPGLTLRAEASAALIRHWNLSQPPHIVAHDNGGLVSLRLFLENSIKFASLCLVDVVAIGPFGLPFFKLVAENQSVFESIPANFLEGFVRAYIRSAAHKPLDSQIEDRLAEQWLDGGSQGPKRFLQEMIQAHNRTTGELEKEYETVGRQIPVKVIWGANDSWLPSEIAERLYKALNAKEVALIEEAGHLVQYDNPSRLAFEIGIWLAKYN